MAAPAAQKVVIVGAGPVGSLAALYAASRGDDVELYELRGGKSFSLPLSFPLSRRCESSACCEDHAVERYLCNP